MAGVPEQLGGGSSLHRVALLGFPNYDTSFGNNAFDEVDRVGELLPLIKHLPGGSLKTLIAR